ncbi:MAG: SDR family NAD(P)-dependent oxidoreductase [Chthonomonadales bacterium]|nr:SDR family NAD(P)-dependent oxidoreductase [Chthonomonadales bacterium]
MTFPWKYALVVGASSGMGAAIARRLAEGGCRVALVARREAELGAVASAINAAREPRALTYSHDVTCAEAVPGLFQQIARDLGGLDLVVYAAGVMPLLSEDEYSFEKDRRTVEVNALGAVAWLNEAALRFGRGGAGTIVGLSSVAGDRGRRGMPVYCASKAFLDTYLEALRNRVGRRGVTVVTVKAGPVDTPMTRQVDRKPLLISPERAAEGILRAASRRTGTAYVPGKWRPIMFVLRHVPSALFQKLNI